MPGSTIFRLTTVILFALLCLSSAVLADTPRDAPSSVSAISSEDFESAKVRDVQALLQLSVPTGDFGDVASAGPRINIRGRSNLNNYVLIDWNMSKTFYGTADEVSDDVSLGSNGFEIGAAGYLNGISNNNGRPDMFGPNAYISIGVTELIEKFDSGDYEFQSSSTNISGTIGLGYDIPITEVIKLGASAEYQRVFESSENSDASDPGFFNVGAVVSYSYDWTNHDRYAENDFIGQHSGIQIGVSGGCAFPDGDFDNAVGSGFSFGGKAVYPITPLVNVVGAGAYQMYSLDGVDDDDRSVNEIVFDAGVQLNVRPILREDTYIQLAISPTIVTEKFEARAETIDESETVIAVTAGIGYRGHLNEKFYIDAAVHTPVVFLTDSDIRDFDTRKLRTELSIMYKFGSY